MIIKDKIYFYIMLLLFSSPFSSPALAADESDPVPVEEVVVTATRTPKTEAETPGMTEVIDPTSVENSGSTAVGDLLANEGIVISTDGGASGVATVNLDGSSGQQTLVMIDGIPANSGTTGTVDLSYFPTTVIDKVEIAHGPLSALYGSGALGGVINISTDLTGESQKLVLLNGGSFQTGDLGLTVRENNWGIAAGGLSTEGYRENSETKNNYLFYQYNFWRQTDNYLTLNLYSMNKYGDSPGSTLYVSNTEQYERNQSLSLSGKRLLSGGLWEYKLYGQFLQNKSTDQVYKTTDVHETANRGLDAAGVYSVGDHELLFGLMLEDEFYDSTKSEHHDRANGAIYCQDNWPVGTKTILNAGIRWDGGTFQSPAIPRISLNYLANENLTFKVGLGKSFRGPTNNDLYWNQPDYGMFGNSDLKPEIGERLDLIMERRKDRQNFTADFFLTRLTDGINWVQTDTYTWSPENIDKSRIKGMNLRYENFWQNGFYTDLGLNWLDKMGWDETTDSYSDDLNTFGRQQWNLGTGYKQQKWNVRLSWHLVRDRAAQYTALMPDYDFLNFSLGYRSSDSLTFSFAVNNLLDESYEIQKYYPMPGREFKIGLNYRF